MKNLAPKLIRQRLMIEMLVDSIPGTQQLARYLNELCYVSKMEQLSRPFVYPADDMGYGGWVHWKTSGAHVYSYPPQVTGSSKALVTVDTYTCKAFNTEDVVNFTKGFFGVLDEEDIEWKEVS